jgi:hypothetical protein
LVLLLGTAADGLALARNGATSVSGILWIATTAAGPTTLVVVRGRFGLSEDQDCCQGYRKDEENLHFLSTDFYKKFF